MLYARREGAFHQQENIPVDDVSTTSPVDGSAAELEENPHCIVASCSNPPITHRQMRVSLPVYGPGSDGVPEVVNRTEQTVQAALCEAHAEMLKDTSNLSKITVFAETTGGID